MKKTHAAMMAVVGGICVLAIKLLAYLVSNSVALLSDAMESIINIAASGLMLFSVYVSEKPADDSHNYGYQKIEHISSLLEGVFILAAAFLIFYAGAGRLFGSTELFELNFAIGISMLATAINGGLSWFLARIAKKSSSAALEGDAKHLLSDVISSVGVWVGLFVVELTGWGFMDSLLAFGVASLIMRMGIELTLTSSHHLLDGSCKEEEEKMKEILARHKPLFIDFHKVRSRRHGNQVFAELHLSVDGSLSVKEAHDFTDHLKDELKHELPSMNLTIHIEPKK